MNAISDNNVNNSEAEETLVSEYAWLVRACARPYFLAGGDSEDLIQEGMLGLLSAIRTYNPDKGTKFTTYAEFCVRRRIYSAIKLASGNKHSPLNSYISLESSQFDESDTQSAYFLRVPEDRIIAREQAGEVENFFTAHYHDLNPVYWSYIWMVCHIRIWQEDWENRKNRSIMLCNE